MATRWRVTYVIPGTKEEKQMAVSVPDNYSDAMTLKNALERGEIKDAYFTPGSIISVMKLKGGY